MGSDRRHSFDPAVQPLLEKAVEANIETGWSRYEDMQEQCAFGSLGLCCRICMMGPCRIDPFGEGAQRGICGISADGIVARNLCRMVAAGASAHSDHAHHMLEVLDELAAGESLDFSVQDAEKMGAFLASLSSETEGSGADVSTRRFVEVAREEFSRSRGESPWLKAGFSKKRQQLLSTLGLIPSGIDPTIRETLHRTNVGVDADPENLLLGSLRCALADLLGMDISSFLSDILLGTPGLTWSEANLGVLREDAVNIALHGHNPLFGESIVAVAPEFVEAAKLAGATGGINLVGVCCTGNELLGRHCIPLATNSASQEVAVLTGSLEAMLVDVQCVMPSLINVCECFHTRLITTSSIAKIPRATHIPFKAATAQDSARKIIELALEAYPKRNHKRVDIPDVKQRVVVGFSVEAIMGLLSKLDQDDPLAPLIESLRSGRLAGLALVAGCNNYKVMQDSSIVSIAKGLLADNILVIATGCAAGSLAKLGLLSPDATAELAGETLLELLSTLGHTAGLAGPLPPVWHMGSCVDNSRVIRLLSALADRLDVDVDQLPVVATAPEAMSEKSMAIATAAVTQGVTTHLGVVPPMMGGKAFVGMLEEGVTQMLGASFVIESNPEKACETLKAIIKEKGAELFRAAGATVGARSSHVHCS